MIALTFNIKDNKVSATLHQAASGDRKEVLESIGQFLVARSKDTIAARGDGGPDGPWPTSSLSELYAGPRTWGDIAQRLQSEVVGDDTVSISSGHIAAGVRQLGTVGAGGDLPDIVPVKKKALTIPISEAASRASYQGKDARTAFPGSFILKKPKGASAQNVGLIVRKIGGRTNKKTGEKTGQKFELLYMLVQKVAIRPHRFIPVDRAGNIAPPAVWDQIVTMITDVFVKPAEGGGA